MYIQDGSHACVFGYNIPFNASEHVHKTMHYIYIAVFRGSHAEGAVASVNKQGRPRPQRHAHASFQLYTTIIQCKIYLQEGTRLKAMKNLL